MANRTRGKRFFHRDPDRRRGVSLSLLTKLQLFSLLLVVIPGVVFAMMTFSGVRKALKDTIGRQLAEVAGDVVDDIEDAVNDERDHVRTWARHDLMRELIIDDVDKRISRFLTFLKKSSRGYVNIVCTNMEGRAVAASDPTLLGKRHEGRAWFRGTRRSGVVMLGPRRSPRHGRVLEIATPVRHPDHPDEVIGALLLLYNWSETTRLSARVRQNLAKLGLNLEVFLLDDTGVVIGGSWSKRFEALRGINLRTAGWRTLQSDAKEAAPRLFVEEPEVAALVASADLDGVRTGWQVLVLQPMSEALAPVVEMQERWVMTLGGVMLAALIVAALLADRMVRPLRALTKATQELGRVGEVRRPVPVQSRDELGDLAEAFNTMTRDLDQTREELVNTAKLAFVGEVAAGIAHEVRTPLGVLRTSVQVLGRSLPADQPKNLELTEMMVAEVDRLDGVVDGLLQLARPRESLMEATSLAEIISRVVEFVEGQAGEKGIRLRTELVAETREAWCDPEQIYQVALNIIINATQVLPPGGEILVRLLPEDAGFVGFEVIDEGPGIPAEDCQRVFAPFFTKREGGIGLGLALAHQVITAHHGSIRAESTPGEGSTFRVRLPVARKEG